MLGVYISEISLIYACSEALSKSLQKLTRPWSRDPRLRTSWKEPVTYRDYTRSGEKIGCFRRKRESSFNIYRCRQPCDASNYDEKEKRHYSNRRPDKNNQLDQ
jgi:hypothetical protein